QTEARSLAAADFDEDGVPDLAGGYAYQDRGIIAIHRGNIDSIYPNAPEAKLRVKNGTFTDAPFLSPARVFEMPVAADFLGAGDFDADGHWDLVLAKRDGTTLHFVLGDGRGSFTTDKDVPLDGQITAFTTGEINRQDGLTDIVVGLNGPQGNRALVFEGPEGALKSAPESFALPAVATSFALGQFAGDYTFDLALAAGNELLIIEGRDRRLSLDAAQQAQVQPARVSTREFEFFIKSLVGGNLSGDAREDIALLSEDGRIHFLTQTALTLKGKTLPRPLTKWPLESLQNNLSSVTTLVRARVSTSPWDSLLALDESGRKLNTISRFPAGRLGTAITSNETGPPGSEMTSLDVDGEPRAILAMRLDVDALSDLVLMKSESSAPTIVRTAAENEARTFATLRPGPSAAGVFGNLAPIAINGTGASPVGGTPYPSTITVSGFTGSLDKVRVRLNNVTKSFANDTHFLVISPGGQKVLVLSGYFAHLNGVDLTFDDNAAAPITAPACCVASGSYKPTVVDPPPSALPAPAPAGPYGKTLAPFVGADPNGTWSLYVSNSDGFTGSVAGGWQLILNDPAPANFVVTNTNDSGAGSLRQAMVDANQKVGADLITFNIQPSGAHTIVPGAALPDVTDPVTIDATTQPGFSGIPLIEIDGSNTGGFAGTYRGVLNMEAGNSVIRGLVINRYNTDAIALLTFGNNIVEGNFIGTDLTGTLDRGNQLTDGIALDSPHN
ncbi:MAG TPA: VCBS repeat-containing protein, partial [Verrucomicrobiae bacterium]